MRRLYVAPAELAGEALLLEDEAAHYLARVLRLAPGDELVLFDGEGRERLARIAEIGRAGVRLELGAYRPPGGPEAPPLTLLVGLAKGEKLDLVFRAATELGVERLWPVAMRRSVVQLERGRAAERRVRWQRIVQAAARQSGRARVPEVVELLPFGDALAAAAAGLPAGAARLLCYEGEHEVRLDACLAGPPPAVVAVVGPEGGLDPEEVAAAVALGYRPVGLGTAILRAETAALAVVTLVGRAYGRLG